MDFSGKYYTGDMICDVDGVFRDPSDFNRILGVLPNVEYPRLEIRSMSDLPPGLDNDNNTKCFINVGLQCLGLVVPGPHVTQYMETTSDDLTTGMEPFGEERYAVAQLKNCLDDLFVALACAKHKVSRTILARYYFLNLSCVTNS